MNQSNLIAVRLITAVVLITIAYLVMYYVIGMEQKKALIVTGVAAVITILPEVISIIRKKL
jgi:hypothetical protein